LSGTCGRGGGGGCHRRVHCLRNASSFPAPSSRGDLLAVLPRATCVSRLREPCPSPVAKLSSTATARIVWMDRFCCSNSDEAGLRAWKPTAIFLYVCCRSWFQKSSRGGKGLGFRRGVGRARTEEDRKAETRARLRCVFPPNCSREVGLLPPTPVTLTRARARNPSTPSSWSDPPYQISNFRQFIHPGE